MHRQVSLLDYVSYSCKRIHITHTHTNTNLSFYYGFLMSFNFSSVVFGDEEAGVEEAGPKSRQQ